MPHASAVVAVGALGGSTQAQYYRELSRGVAQGRSLLSRRIWCCAVWLHLGQAAHEGRGHRQSGVIGQSCVELCQDGYVDRCSYLVQCSLPANSHALPLILY